MLKYVKEREQTEAMNAAKEVERRKKKERIEDVLTCNICFDRYDEEVKIPLILKCGHTVCKECAKQLVIDF